MNCCPKCGCKEAYMREFHSGYGSLTMDLETGDIDYSSMYFGLQSKRIRKYWICCNCSKRLFKDDSVEINKALEEEDGGQ